MSVEGGISGRQQRLGMSPMRESLLRVASGHVTGRESEVLLLQERVRGRGRQTSPARAGCRRPRGHCARAAAIATAIVGRRQLGVNSK